MRFDKKYSYVLILVLPVVFVCLYYFQNRTMTEEKAIKIKGREFYIEIASNASSREKGLSKRDDLCEYCGMLFVFDKKEKHSFWMHETRFPLDILWLNDGKIVHIEEGAAAYSDAPMQPDNTANAVLEIPAGTVSKYGIAIGDVLELE